MLDAIAGIRRTLSKNCNSPFFMALNVATSVPAEVERFPRKGAVQEVVTCDRLHNRERQSLSQVSQLATAFPTPTSSHNLGRRQNDQIWFKKINDY